MTLGQRIVSAMQAHIKEHGKMGHDWPVIVRRIGDDIEKAMQTPSATQKAIHVQIYEAYPRHVGRDKALAAIARACKQHDPAWILQKTRTFGKHVAKWPRQYRFDDQSGRDLVPHPTTWFNQGRYQDDESEWKLGGQDATSVPRVAERTPPEPAGWVDRLLAKYPDCGWEKHDAHALRRGSEFRRWPDMGPLGMWRELLEQRL